MTEDAKADTEGYPHIRCSHIALQTRMQIRDHTGVDRSVEERATPARNRTPYAQAMSVLCIAETESGVG